MNKPIHWPPGDFTIQAAIDLNSHVPQSEVRSKLSEGLADKTIVQTQKGNGKIKGKFRLANSAPGGGPLPENGN
jgi:hypothetical protein